MGQKGYLTSVDIFKILRKVNDQVHQTLAYSM